MVPITPQDPRLEAWSNASWQPRRALRLRSVINEFDYQGLPDPGDRIYIRSHYEADERVSRIYGEPITVTECDGKPVGFGWQERNYRVLAVLEHWVISRQWWQQQDPSIDIPPEWEFWRVEASAGQDDDPTAVYELRRDTGSGDWLLSRVWD